MKQNFGKRRLPKKTHSIYGPDTNGGQSSTNLVEAMNSQHLVEEKLKAREERGPDPNGGQSSPNRLEATISEHLVEEKLKAPD